MKFIISKASDGFCSYLYDEEEDGPPVPPIEGAVLNTIDLDNKFFDGTSPHKVWTYEIDDLEELLGLIKSTGKNLIIYKPENQQGLHRLVIYDSYVE